MGETDRSKQVSIEIEELNKHLACSLRDKLHKESPSQSENCIFKVPGTFKRRNESIYEPKIVSIGPFHHGNKYRLAPMQKIKLWYLDSLLARLPLPPEKTLQHFIESIRELANRASNCYAKGPKLSECELVEMMIVDGCFLLELFRRSGWLVPQHIDDPIFTTSWMHVNLYHDLVLLENQIPWFVLQRLFELTASDNEQEADFLVVLVLNFFDCMMLMTIAAEFKSGGREIKHILDLIRRSLLSSSDHTEPKNTKWEIFPPVTDLLQAGARFKKGPPDNILNIKFDNGVFEIPPIKIRVNSEALFRNLIAYEQCDRQCSNKFTSYAVFLGCLINTSKDVDFLSDKGILIPDLSAEDVSILFNRLYTNTLLYESDDPGESLKVKAYYRSRWPKWRAILQRDYFNNPWSTSSFIAALLILVFTFLQTFFTIRSCPENNSC